MKPLLVELTNTGPMNQPTGSVIPLTTFLWGEMHGQYADGRGNHAAGTMARLLEWFVAHEKMTLTEALKIVGVHEDDYPRPVHPTYEPL